MYKAVLLVHYMQEMYIEVSVIITHNVVITRINIDGQSWNECRWNWDGLKGSICDLSEVHFKPEWMQVNK